MNLMELMVTIGVDDQATSKVDSISTGMIAKGTALGQAMYSAVSSAASAIGSAVESVVGGAYEQYSAYEQNVGGIQKLFGNMGQTLEEYAAAQGSTTEAVASEWQALENAQNTVLQNASNAYKTAGVSANQYMEQVTSFSAALINSLDGDTQAAAAQADVAMRAISDNVNTFGSNVEDVQNAYQGFAKQNYTMLDNLKLGYGGTQSEMERLISDANEYADSIGQASDLSIDSFSDIVTAIELVQEKQNIAGTTSREAASTLEGSLNTLKAAWTNWLTELGKDDADMGKLTEQLVDSLSAAASNALPRLALIVGTLVSEVPGLVAQYAPAAAEEINNVVTDALSILGDMTGIDFTGMWDGLIDGASQLGETFEPVISAFEGMAEAAAPVVNSLVDGFGNGVSEYLMPALENLAPVLEGLFGNLEQLMPYLEPIAELLGSTIATAITLIVDVVTSVATILADVVAALGEFLGAIEAAPETISNFVTQAGEWFGQLPDLIGGFLSSVVSSIGEWVSNVVSNAASAGSGFLASIGDFFSQLPGNVAGFLSSAIGNISSFVGSVWGYASSAGQGFLNGIRDGFNAAVSFVAGIPGQIISALGDVGNLLVSAGSSIIEGLKSGITGAISGVYDFVSGIADTIASLKGPIPYDKKVLIPNGEALMASLATGLKSGFGDVESLVGGMADSIAGDLSANVSVTGGAKLAQSAVYGSRAAATQRTEDARVAKVTSWLAANLPGIIAENAPNLVIDNDAGRLIVDNRLYQLQRKAAMNRG